MRHVIAGDVGATNIRFCLVDERGFIQKRIEEKTPKNTKDIISKILSLIESFNEDVSRVSIGVAGIVNFKSGHVKLTPNFDFSDVPLKEYVEEKFNVECVVDNDANMAAWGEKVFGSAKNSNDFICLTLGTGIGAGIVINGSIFRGFYGAAGEVGHMSILNSDTDSPCEFEKLASGSALGETTKAFLKEKRSGLMFESVNGDIDLVTGKTVTNAARGCDPDAIKQLEKFTEILSIGISSLVDVLDPEIIVLSGGMASDGDLFLPSVRKHLYGKIFAPHYRKPAIIIGTLGPDAGIIGAAALAIYDDGRKFNARDAT